MHSFFSTKLRHLTAKKEGFINDCMEFNKKQLEKIKIEREVD